MKKTVFTIVAVLLILFPVWSISARADGDWSEKPIITHVYEYDKGKIALEWKGNSVLYQINVDGKTLATVNVEHTVIDLKNGLHQLAIIPIQYQSKNKDTSLELELKGGIKGVESGVSGNIDLGAFGIDPQELFQGISSDLYKIRYTADPFFSAVPQVVGAYTDFNDCVYLSFTDKYDSDSYVITIKSGKDINYIEFNTEDKDAAALITKENSSVTITLNQEYLKSHRCLVPELDQKYGFSVKLQKYPENDVDGTKEHAVILESKESKTFEYTPYAAWKNPPEITYASQTADGEVTLRWDHNTNGLNCDYSVVELGKQLGIKTKETNLGRTSKSEFVVKDLMNGKHVFADYPIYENNRGISSASVGLEVMNSWVIAPTLYCEIKQDNNVLMKWTSPNGIESYHLTVSAGSRSLLKFINLDYKKYKELDIQAKPGSMEYTFSFNDINIDAGDEVKLKFELVGIRHAANGDEQRSAATTQTFIVKKQ